MNQKRLLQKIAKTLNIRRRCKMSEGELKEGIENTSKIYINRDFK